MIVDYLSLTISVGAVITAVSTFVINYRRSRKTEQLKLCIDITARLNAEENKISEIMDNLKSNTTDRKIIEGWRINLRSAYLSYLNQWEFFSFLVNTKEIHEEKILDYYKDKFKKDLLYWFNNLPDFRDEIETYEEIKKLVKKWDPEYYSLYFESK